MDALLVAVDPAPNIAGRPARQHAQESRLAVAALEGLGVDILSGQEGGAPGQPGKG
jgi:hypothetical protein